MHSSVHFGEPSFIPKLPISLILGVRIRIMLATFLRDVTATFLSVMDTYIRTYVHHENRSRIRKLATLAIICINQYYDYVVLLLISLLLHALINATCAETSPYR